MTAGMIIRNGRVFRSGQGSFQQRDIYIKGSKFTNPFSFSENNSFIREFNGEGLLFTPPLADFHCHLYYGGVDNAIDPLTLPAAGVLYACDAGSAGIANISGLYSLKNQLQDRLKIYNWLNISSIGLIVEKVPEAQPEFCVTLENYLDLSDELKESIVGIAVRISHNSINDSINVDDTLDQALDLASVMGLPLMVHISRPCFPLDVVMEQLRPGDVVSQIYHDRGEGILDSNGQVKKIFWKSREKGVFFETAHGRFHFSFSVAQKCLQQGFLPDFISTNLTSRTAFQPPVYGLANLLSKHLALGMSIEEVLVRGTRNPANYLKIKGYPFNLAPGENASFVAWDIQSGKWDFTDSYGGKLRGDKLLAPVLVVKDGVIISQRDEWFIQA